MDHRWGLRVPIDVPVVLIYPAHAIGMGRMTEISTSGALVRTDFTPPDLVSLRIAGVPRPPQSEGFEGIEAFVVRREPRRVAVEWAQFSSLPVRALLVRLSSSIPSWIE